MKITYWYVIILVVVVVFVGFQAKSSSTSNTEAASTKYDEFAQCISDAGASFYGAFWCPHCQEQKALFEQSPKIPYIECSTPNGEGRTEICTTENITGYPTWKFADGTESSGVQTLATLAEKTSCTLPN